MEEIALCTNVFDKMTTVLVTVRTIYPEWEVEIDHYLNQASILKTEMVLGQRDAELTSEYFLQMVRTILDKID